MNPFRLALAATIASAVLGGCNDGHGPSTGQDGNSPSQPRHVRSTRASRLGDEFTLSCQAGGCPASTGVLFISTYLESGFCTAWVAGELEGKTVLMTNKHCVEKSSDCSEDLAFKFPATGESAQCEKLLAVSQYALDNGGKIAIVPDYAIIQLDRKLNAQPLKLSQEGLPFESAVNVRKAWKMSSRSIEMREEKCSTGTTDWMVSDYKGATSPNISLYGCNVIGGNSGSPILNTKGEVAAIVQIGPKGEGLSFPSIPGLDAKDFDIDTFAVGTNLACIKNPELGLDHPAAGCEVVTGGEASRPKFSDMFNARIFLKLSIHDYAEFIREDDSGIFGWTVRPDDGGRVTSSGSQKPLLTLELTPKCFLRPTDADSKLKAKYYDNGYAGYFAGWKKQGDLQTTSPGWGIGLKLDKFGGFAVNFILGSKAARYDFIPEEINNLKADGAVKVVETVGSQKTDLMLPLCPNGFRSRDLKENAEAEDAVKRGDDKALDELLKRQTERAKNE